MGAVITIPYRQRNWAKPFHASLKRWSVLVLHRRAGKTTAVLNHHLRAALDDDWERRRLKALLPSITDAELRDLLKRRVYWHVMPTYHQGKITGAWDTLKEISRPVPGAKPNEAELLVTLPNGNKIQIIGGDKPDSLRGPALSGVSLDEFSQIPANAFSEVLSKSLADHVGYAVFCGTIKGTDQLYATHEAAKGSSEWFALWQAVDRSLETEEGATIEALRRAMEDDRKLVVQGLMTQGEFDQEWFLSREAAIKGAFYALELRQAREQGRICRVPYDPSLTVDTDWDLGIDAMAVWFSQSTRGGEVRLIDYHEDVGGGLPASIKVVKEKPYIYGQHWAPHDIEVTEIASGLTRRQAAAGLGIRFEVTPKIAVADGITALQLLLARCWFDEEKTKAGMEALLHYRRTWNQRLGRFTEEPFHDWSCFTVDTKVLMRFGPHQAQVMAIMDLPEGGEVLTPCGWRRYHGPKTTRRNARLVEVRFEGGHTVRCTPDHLFATDRGWRSAESLMPGSLILSCLIHSASTSTGVCIDSGRANVTSHAVASAYTEMSGVQRLVRSLTDAIYTIAMAILPTTPWPTWSASPRVSTCPALGTSESPQGLASISPPQHATPLRHGIAPRPVEHGIDGMRVAPRLGRSGSARTVHVSSAVRSFMARLFARTASRRSTVPRAARLLRIASVAPLAERDDTCCIHVPDVECFALANGAVVHNSHGADAARGLAVRYQAPRERKRGKVPEMPKSWMGI